MLVTGFRRLPLAVAALAAALLAGCGSDDGDPGQPGGSGGAGGGAAGSGGVGGTAGGDPAGSLLYVGPHPDDEFYAAPLLGHLCRESGWTCTLVVATRGEGGSCGLPEGCHPDLATVRAAEMAASAELLGATLIHWDLGDNGQYQPYAGDVEEVLELWADRAGGTDALLQLVRGVIEETAPDFVITMDPRHGNYCHPTHRALGAVVAQTILDLGNAAPETRMLSAAWFNEGNDFGFRPLVDTDPSLQSYDGSAPSTVLSGETWLYVLRVLQTHRSQFDVSSISDEAFASTPDPNKRIWWAPLDQAVPQDPAYQDLCAPSTF